MRRKQFSENTIKFYIAGLILALCSIHEEGYIYRDLKPENVLIDADGYPKLCDFGLSTPKEFINLKTWSKQWGSKQYFSPEIVWRQLYGNEVDWWWLGILTYELLFGFTPFEDDNIFAANNKIKNDIPKFDERDDLSPEWVDFISKLLSKSKYERLGLNEIDDFISHPWLLNINWDAMKLKALVAPFQIEKNMMSETHFFWNDFTERNVESDFLFSKY